MKKESGGVVRVGGFWGQNVIGDEVTSRVCICVCI